MPYRKRDRSASAHREAFQDHRIKQATADRVLACVERRGYAVNLTAHSLCSRHHAAPSFTDRPYLPGATMPPVAPLSGAARPGSPVPGRHSRPCGMTEQGRRRRCSTRCGPFAMGDDAGLTDDDLAAVPYGAGFMLRGMRVHISPVPEAIQREISGP